MATARTVRGSGGRAAGPGGRTGDEGYWLISSPGDVAGTPVPMLTGGGRVLPVFGSREEAAEFLLPGGAGGGWRAEVADPAGLLSVLSGPSCAGVETVTLDPIPGISDGASARLVGVGVGRFAWQLVRRPTGEVA